MIEPRTCSRQTGPRVGRLILCNIGRAGDTILRNSILDSAFRTYVHVDYICGRHNSEIVRADPRLCRVTVVRSLPAALGGLVISALRHRYDGYIDLKDHSSSTSLIIARLFRSRVKTGFNGRHFRPFQRDTRTVVVPGVHQVEITRRIGALAGLVEGEYKPAVAVPRDSVSWFEKEYPSARPFIFINLSAASPSRIWPVSCWARFVRGCGLSDNPILVNGLPKHQDMVWQLCRELPGAVAFRARHFMDVTAAVARASLVLTVDTGVVHACSALDRPVVALYRADRTLATHSPLSSWHLVIRPRAGVVPDIDPEQAIADVMGHGLPPMV